MPEQAPYGSWKSPISAGLITSGAVGLGQIALDGGDVYWAEMRPSEGGRVVIVRRGPDGTVEDITPAPFSARTRVHEYGGGAFTVADGTVFFSNYNDQRIYRQDRGQEPQPITPESSRMRYADGVYDWDRGRIICVREEHLRGDPLNAIVSVDADGVGPEQVLFDDSDFCSTPRLNPEGNLLSWLAWDHPNMPWDGVRLFVAEIYDDGELGEPELVAGGDYESIFQPEWSPDGVLHFVSDESGWWNIYRWNEKYNEIEALTDIDAEFARPQWVFGAATYGFVGNDAIVCSYVERGQWKIALLDTESLDLEPLDNTFTEMGRGDLKAADGKVVFTAGAPSEPMTLFFFDAETGRSEVLRRSHETRVGEGYLSMPQAVEFPTSGGRTAHAFYYPPKNQDFSGPDGEKPPLLVKTHGGPTSAASTALDLGIQFWTSRGIGVLDVNYGGSTGYGTKYRRRLEGAWGVVDVEDCSNAARYMVERGEVDGERLAIDGGSAGGYTTLAALTFGNTFKAGASYYGVSDLESLAKDTHKFESRYLDGLVGPYPEREDLYRKRSPINHTDLLSCPLILFQGLEDKIVPPNQAQMMFDAVRDKGLPTAYLPFEGEQHGFRRAENIVRALEAELYFYSRVFGFPLADEIDPVEIENLAQPEVAGEAGGAGVADAPDGPAIAGGAAPMAAAEEGREAAEAAALVGPETDTSVEPSNGTQAFAPLEAPETAAAIGAADSAQPAAPFNMRSVVDQANAVDIEDLAEQVSSAFVDNVAKQTEAEGTSPAREPRAAAETEEPSEPPKPPDIAALVSRANSIDIEELAAQIGPGPVNGSVEIEDGPAKLETNSASADPDIANPNAFPNAEEIALRGSADHNQGFGTHSGSVEPGFRAQGQEPGDGAEASAQPEDLSGGYPVASPVEPPSAVTPSEIQETQGNAGAAESNGAAEAAGESGSEAAMGQSVEVEAEPSEPSHPDELAKPGGQTDNPLNNDPPGPPRSFPSPRDLRLS